MSANSTSPHNAQNWLLLAALTLIWGSSYILIKKGEVAFTAIQLACLRVSISCIAALPFAVKGFRLVPRQKLFTVLQVGFFGSGAPAFLFALSISKSGSAVNGIINSLSPLWTLVIGYYLYKVHITRQKVLGVFTGFAGALVLVLGKGGSFNVDLLYSFLPLLATFCYGMSSNITKQHLQNENPIYTTSLAMAMMGLPVVAGLFFSGAPQIIINAAKGSVHQGLQVNDVWNSLAAIIFLSIFGTLIAWILFYRLVQRTDALFAASVTYLIPIIAVGWGLFDGEVFNLIQLLGMALILVGVYFTTRTVKQPAANS